MTARASDLDPAIARQLKRDGSGLFPAVAQQYDSGEVLMVGWMDDEALHRTLTTGRATYWSRSRAEYWVKGDTSGHVQWVRSVALDCDGDTVLVRVDQVGPACHTGTHTCFTGRELSAGGARPLPPPAATFGSAPAPTSAPAPAPTSTPMSMPAAAPTTTGAP
ncbi:phosphoribosyl-AMP cyclohydrolase [Parafrankia discariae]|uniref:phosphoribosyl-AMP cyclohydrolase n=1 Tax=Parafrankia discariae TaxID=365528 RepID=UPI00036ADACF|nr:phosphoribosyl-AMP cyclohydrolase [Parafrankia discariae]